MLPSYFFRRMLAIGPIRRGERPVITLQSVRLKATVLLTASSSALTASPPPMYIALPDFRHFCCLKAAVLNREMKLRFASIIIIVTDGISDTCYTHIT
jgi:hypothetical protein